MVETQAKKDRTRAEALTHGSRWYRILKVCWDKPVGLNQLLRAVHREPATRYASIEGMFAPNPYGGRKVQAQRTHVGIQHLRAMQYLMWEPAARGFITTSFGKQAVDKLDREHAELVSKQPHLPPGNYYLDASGYVIEPNGNIRVTDWSSIRPLAPGECPTMQFMVTRDSLPPRREDEVPARPHLFVPYPPTNLCKVCAELASHANHQPE